jgi:hypothetical protein
MLCRSWEEGRDQPFVVPFDYGHSTDAQWHGNELIKEDARSVIGSYYAAFPTGSGPKDEVAQRQKNAQAHALAVEETIINACGWLGLRTFCRNNSFDYSEKIRALCQPWHLQNLRDGGGPGFTVELFLFALNEVLSLSESPHQDPHSTLYIATFRVITSDWRM